LAPCLKYDFQIAKAGDATIKLHALPTMRLTMGGHLRVAVGIDDNSPKAFDVPGGESDNELGKARRDGVLANRVTITVPTGQLSVGHHLLKVYGVDPGVVLDQIEFPGR
jgi:hypothetical protein